MIAWNIQWCANRKNVCILPWERSFWKTGRCDHCLRISFHLREQCQYNQWKSYTCKVCWQERDLDPESEEWKERFTILLILHTLITETSGSHYNFSYSVCSRIRRKLSGGVKIMEQKNVQIQMIKPFAGFRPYVGLH